MSQGRFFVIEGTDGSGKGTQFVLLKERLEKDGYAVESFDFPQYGQPSAYFVEQYLNGHYGGADEVGAYKGSLFYALDRFEASFAMRRALEDGKIVLCNRYVGSNMGHQGAKMADKGERQAYFAWLDNLEFEILGIPRPHLNIVLHVPAEIAQELVSKKDSRAYIKGGKTHDIHEADLGHLKKSEQVYLEMCELFPSLFTKIGCVREGKLQSIESIADDVWSVVSKELEKK